MVVTSLALVVGAEWGRVSSPWRMARSTLYGQRHQAGRGGGGESHVAWTRLSSHDHMADFAGLYAARRAWFPLLEEEAWQCATNMA